MPRERRKIISTAEELVLAVRSHDRVTAEFLPADDVRAVQVEDRDGVRLMVSLRPQPSGAACTIDVARRDVIELLIRACLENIPIPRRAAKSLTVVDGDLAMVMDLVDEDAVGPLPQRPRPQAAARCTPGPASGDLIPRRPDRCAS